MAELTRISWAHMTENFFLGCTKISPGRIASHLPPDWGSGYPNVWIGVSTDQIEEQRDIAEAASTEKYDWKKKADNAVAAAKQADAAALANLEKLDGAKSQIAVLERQTSSFETAITENSRRDEKPRGRTLLTSSPRIVAFAERHAPNDV